MPDSPSRPHVRHDRRRRAGADRPTVVDALDVIRRHAALLAGVDERGCPDGADVAAELDRLREECPCMRRSRPKSCGGNRRARAANGGEQ